MKQRPHGRPGGDIFERLPPDLRKEIQDLRKHEKRVLQALQDEEMSKLFRSNPAAALARMKIDLSPVLRKRLGAGAPEQGFSNPPSFLLPNGKRITPRVRIRFVAEKED